MTALGIERGIVVFWEQAGGEGYCTPDGYSIDVKGEDESSWTTYTDGPDASSYTVLDLEPGRYQVRVRPHVSSGAGGIAGSFAGSFGDGARAALSRGASAPGNGGALFNENAPPDDGVSGTAEVTVPADCSVILEVSATGGREISGSWTNASSEYGCEAGGVYVEYREATLGSAVDLSHSGLARDLDHKVNGGIASAGYERGTCDGVSGVKIISSAGTNQTYGNGDVIRVCVVFSQKVYVTGSPRLKIKFFSDQWVDYESGSGTDRLVFSRQVVPANNTQLGVEVVANSLELNGGQIITASASTTLWDSSFRVPNEDEDFNRFIYGDLDGDQGYEFRVRAIDARGMGKDTIDSSWERTSNSDVVQSLDSPTINSVTGIPGGVTVTWNDFAPDGVTVTGYKARFREKLGFDWTTTSDSNLIDATARAHDVTGMTFGKDYWVEVGAVTSTHELWSKSHEGSPSSTGIATDPFMAWFARNTPNRNFTLGRIFMDLETNRNASGICHINNGDSIQCPDSTLVSLGAAAGGEYNIRGVATGGGETARTPTYKLTDNGFVREAKVSGGDGKMAVAWTKTRYVISGKTLKSHVIKYEKTGGDAVWVQQGVDDTSHTITGLTNGDYKVWVYGCVNASTATTEASCMVDQGDGTYANETGAELSGAGAEMNVSLASGIFGTPGAPREVRIEQLRNHDDSAFINQMKVSWKRPLDDGGADVHRYKIRYTPTGGEAVFEDVVTLVPHAVFNTSHDHQIKDLTVGTTYSVAVKAFNVSGESEWSNEVTITLQ